MLVVFGEGWNPGGSSTRYIPAGVFSAYTLGELVAYNPCPGLVRSKSLEVIGPVRGASVDKYWPIFNVVVSVK